MSCDGCRGAKIRTGGRGCLDGEETKEKEASKRAGRAAEGIYGRAGVR